MKIMERYKIFLWRYWIAICVVLVCASCSDDDKELQEYLTPVSGSETIFDQGFSSTKMPLHKASALKRVRAGKLR